jgi:glutamate carboxypeptidase
MQSFLRYATEHQPDILALIRDLVQCESPSDSPERVNRCLDLLADRTSDIAVAEFVDTGHGNALKLTFRCGRADGQILGIGHADTVWPLGTLEQMPFRENDGRLWGPGVLDMKAGLAFFVFAVRALIATGVQPRRKICLLVVPDEEIGSLYSRAITEAEARKSDVVLVIEPGTGLEGKLKTARKGIGHYTIHVEGKAAHSGVDLESGASAVVEAARQVLRVAELTDLQRGLTVNPGVIQGGTRSNVVAAEARIEVDVRVERLADARAVDGLLRSLSAFDERCQIRVEGGLNRPPMERTPTIAALAQTARSLAARIGVVLEESSTGGGSDGNFTAALGVPTLDGLGGVGEGMHAGNESLLIHRIPDRVAVLAGLLDGL